MLGLETIFDPTALALVAAGTALGILVGAIPGLTGAMLISLSLPLTFSMEAGHALVLLVSMYVGSVSGGLVSATLLHVPGTPASVMTTLDGYPMARSGRAGRALGLGISASLAGGLISWVFLVSLAGPVARWSTRMGPFEMFALVLMALVLMAAVSGRSLAAGFFSGFLGVLASMPGMAPGTGQLRLTFGFTPLHDGFKLLPVLIGLFAVARVLSDAGKRPQHSSTEERASFENAPAAVFLKLAEWKGHALNLLRSGLLGTAIGILPGVGANIGSLVAYSAAKHFSRNPGEFGRGAESGVVASESANNATVGGALIPLISLGIPGSVIDAILLGAFVIHGLQPGPMLFQNDPEIVRTILGSYFWANILMFVLMLAGVRYLARLNEVPAYLLSPVILSFCVLGSYALANRFFDVWVMLGFGILGFCFDRLRIPPAPFVIGFVLAPIAEENLCAALMQSGGSYLPLLTRPVALCFSLCAAAMVGLNLWNRRSKGVIRSGRA